jgi:predicted DNA-binding protein
MVDRDHALVVDSLRISREIRDRLIQLSVEAELSPLRRVDLPSGPSFTAAYLSALLTRADIVASALEKFRKQMEDTLRLENKL